MSRGRRIQNQEAKEKVAKKTGVSLFFKIIAIIFLVVTIIFYVKLIKLDMLPMNYLIIGGAVTSIATLLLIFGIIKRKSNNVFRVIFTIISICVMAVYVYGINNIDATMKFVESSTSIAQEKEEYYILVLKTSKYNEVKDLKGKDVYVFSADEDYEDVKKDITKEVQVQFKEDDSVQALASNILSGKSEAVLLSNSQYLMLKDEQAEFVGKTKIIYTSTHKIENTADEVVDVNSNNLIKDGIFNIYISGIDTDGNISNVSRTDVNMVVSVNTNTHKILLTSIPRDYYVTLHSKKAKDKLTHSGIYGIKETVSTVEDLLDIDINYYVRVNFTTLIKVVDTLGGIDVDSEYAFTAVSGQKFVKGNNYLNGTEALAFSRERHAFESGDRQRVKNQQAVLTAIINKVIKSNTILTKYPSLLKSLSGSFQTNISQENISLLVKEQLDNMKGWSIQTTSLNGTGAMLTTYSYGNQKLYVMLPDETTVNSAKEKINTILSK